MFMYVYIYINIDELICSSVCTDVCMYKCIDGYNKSCMIYCGRTIIN